MLGAAALPWVIVLAWPQLALAGSCNVPGSHATIQEAVDDPGCSTVELAAQVYPESVTVTRSLTLQGALGGGSTIEGRLIVDGADTDVTATDLAVDTSTANLAGCFSRALEVRGSAALAGQGLQIRNSLAGFCPAGLIFSDGFESGDISAWTGSVP